MGLSIFRRYVLGLAIIGGLAYGLGARMHGQVSPTSKSAKERKTSSNGTRPKVYEDDEVKILIPVGWVVAINDHPAVGPYQEAGSSMTEARRKLVLAKNGYTLALAFDTEHASGVAGGTFIEVFRIPWLNAEQALICSRHFSGDPQPVSKTSILTNLSLNTGDSQVRDNCHVSKDLGYLTDQGETNSLVGQQRWFAGYFTTADRNMIFQSKGVGCGQKAYTLTSKGKTPEELPVAGDPDLRAIIKEASEIVDSIHYKRCPPTSASRLQGPRLSRDILPWADAFNYLRTPLRRCWLRPAFLVGALYSLGHTHNPGAHIAERHIARIPQLLIGADNSAPPVREESSDEV